MRTNHFFLSVTLLLLAACSGSDADEASDQSTATEVGDAASPAARALFATYIEEEGEDFDACFKDLPEIRADPANAKFQDGQGIASSNALNRVMIAIDASGSMAGRVGGQAKMLAAKSAASDFVAELPDNVEVGLIAFGHKGDNSQNGRARSCAAVETVHPLGAVNRDKITEALQSFNATGWTPLASAIKNAGQSFAPTYVAGSQVVYIVSDGEETCGGDPVAAARALHSGNIQAVVNIIGFDLAASDRKQLQAVASAGGGEFVEVDTPGQLQNKLREAARRRDNNIAMGRTNVQNNTQMGGNALRTNLAVAKLSTCITNAWSKEKRGLRLWLKPRQSDNEISAEVRGMIDQRRDTYRERADAFEKIARRREQQARDVLEADRERARSDYEKVQGD